MSGRGSSTPGEEPAGATDGTETSDYTPPTVEPLGRLPESTGMPASPQTFPESPTR